MKERERRLDKDSTQPTLPQVEVAGGGAYSLPHTDTTLTGSEAHPLQPPLTEGTHWPGQKMHTARLLRSIEEH